jgi:hypothetical protein
VKFPTRAFLPLLRGVEASATSNDIGQTSVAKYMAKGRGSRSQGWKTFLHNQISGVAAIDLFVVPTISFYGLVILRLDRRQILWLGVTAHPSAAPQFTEACGWDYAPRYLVRDRDSVYDEIFVRRLRALGFATAPIAPRSSALTTWLFWASTICAIYYFCMAHITTAFARISL